MAIAVPRTRGAASIAYSRSVTLDDGARTTVHVSAYDLRRNELRVHRVRAPQTLPAWCRRNGVDDAIVGGFFVRPGGVPLGELRIGGVRQRSVPFDDPWAGLRSCVHADNGRVRIAARPDLPARPDGDLLQAGPLLVSAGRVVLRDDQDREGFSAGSAQFDSDITAGRYPRAALGVVADLVFAVACDGRSDEDAGMTLAELAAFMCDLGAQFALNLDGGGSTSLVRDGLFVNSPREQDGVDLAGGRPISTALAFLPRR